MDNRSTWYCGTVCVLASLLVVLGCYGVSMEPQLDQNIELLRILTAVSYTMPVKGREPYYVTAVP